MLRTESDQNDAAQSAILSLIDGPRDMRFAMTAKALARHQTEGSPMTELTALNMHKVTRFREDGEAELEAEVKRLTLSEAAEQQRLEDEYKEDGTQYEWTRGPGRRAGPGRVVKRVVESGSPGTDPRDFVRKFGGRKARSPRP